MTFAPIFDVRARFKMPKREPKTKVKKHQVEELSLLVNGLSFSSLDVGSIRDAIQKLDARLEENTASLQESWGQFVDVCSTISNEKTQDPPEWLSSKDAVDLLASSDVIQTSSCPYEPIALNCFLNNVIQALERNPGKEESIFEDLVQFASQQGILMPFGAPEKNGDGDETYELPLNTIVIEDEQATDVLWEAIRRKIRKGMWTLLANLPLSNQHNELNCDQQTKIKLLADLCFLYPAEDIWKGYQNYRKKLLDQYIASEALLEEVETDLAMSSETPNDVRMFVKLCKASEIMIYEDAMILQEGIFSTTVPSFEFIHESYLLRITEELHSVCQEVYNKEKEEQVLLNELGQASSHRRGSNVSFGSRRGSTLSNVKKINSRDILLAYKHCFMAVVHLERLVNKVTSQKDTEGGAGIRGTSLQNASRSPSSPVLSHRNPSRHSSKKNPDMPLYVAEGNLPLPFGSGSSRLDSQPLSSVSAPNPNSPWPWREEFKSHISKLSMALSESIKHTCEKALEEGMQMYKSTQRIHTVRLRDDFIGGKQDYPRRIDKCCAAIMEEADEVLPLASSQGGKLFHVIRSSFVDSLEVSLKSYHTRLTQLLSDFPKVCDVECLFIVLGSAVFIRNHLVHYEDVLGSEPRRPFPLLHRQFSDLVDSVSDQIISYHDNVISMVILQDARSNNWSDSRPFFEDQRCSFSVQMWNYHLQGLRHDLWNYCPPEKAQEMFTSVLHSSLVTIVTRYSHVCPTSRRVKQFRSDITAMLLSTLSFLWSCCKSVPSLLDPKCSVAPFPTIHSLCSCLLTTLAVVGSPLDSLCSHVMGETSGSTETAQSKTAWLSWIYPEVFKSHEGSLAALTDRQATFVLFKLMVNQPGPQWPLFIRALLSRNAKLPVTIVKYGELSSLRTPVNGSHSELVQATGSSLFEEESTSSVQSAKKFKEGVVCSLYHILFQCSNEMPGLVNYLMAIVSREASWKLFDDGSSGLKISDATESPVWLECVFKTFDPYIVRFLYPSLLLLCEQDKKVTKSYNFTSMSALPCGCERKKSPKTRDTESQTDVQYTALQDLLNQLTKHFCAIPKIMCQFLNKLQESVHQKSTDQSSETAGITVLASILYRWLMDFDKVCVACEARLSPETQRSVAMFAEIVWHVFVNLGRTEGGVRNPALPSDLDALLISKRDWLNQKVGQIKAYIASQPYEEFSVETVCESLADIQFTHMASALLAEPKGAACLRHAYNFIQAQKDWLMNLVFVPGHVLPPVPSNSIPGTEQSERYNPLRQFALIGECDFNQDKIASFPFDWSTLLQSCLGASADIVKRLAFNRSEMQGGAFLEDSQRKLVNALKAHFGVTVDSGNDE